MGLTMGEGGGAAARGVGTEGSNSSVVSLVGGEVGGEGERTGLGVLYSDLLCTTLSSVSYTDSEDSGHHRGRTHAQ